ncbi:hypothetical protein [Microbispora triticiradicis]|uniref:hypothetical protein n=1 Tax=Microbispora triticiradicis TaxID=2200763 RepID=UPI001AD7B6C2|nr:hypothetical protein [Microbispora triticiradicis]MBO4271094.1 hypothetical protein [Microbispora triticiradicis]
MRRATGYTIAWCGATALAVGVSWLGVRDVLRSAVLDDAPLAPVVAVAAPVTAYAALPSADPGTDPDAAATPGPLSPSPSLSRSLSPTPRPARRNATATPSRTARSSPSARAGRPEDPAGSAPPPPSARPRRDAEEETLHTFTLKGGRATIAVTSKDCRVVTATPNDGYQVKVWEEEQWLRVAFLREVHESSAFCAWNALPPRLDTYER